MSESKPAALAPPMNVLPLKERMKIPRTPMPELDARSPQPQL